MAAAGAIVVLGSGLRSDMVMGEGSLHRAIRGIELYRKGFAPLHVFTGPAGNTGESGAAVRSELVQAMGISPDGILTEPLWRRANHESGVSRVTNAVE